MAQFAGHAPYAWSVLGAVAQATERVDLATYVTCPTMRYHPAVVAQKAATMQILPTDGSPWAWAAGRTSTSTSSGADGPPWDGARRCSGSHPDHSRPAVREHVDGKGDY